MKTLIDIVRLVSSEKLRQTDVLNTVFEGKKQSHLYRLYVAVRDSKVQTDAEAEEWIYGKKAPGTSGTSDKYRALKSELKARLLQALLLISYRRPAHSSYRIMYHECNRDIAAIRLLVADGYETAAFECAQVLEHEAGKYQITDVWLQCLRILRAYYSRRDPNKFDIYCEKVQRVERLCRYEDEARQSLQYLYALHARKKPDQAQALEFARGIVPKLSARAKRYNSHNLRVDCFRIEAIALQLSGDYRELNKSCLRMERYLSLKKNRHFVTTGLEGEFALHRMVSYTHLGEFGAGNTLAERCRSIYTPGTDNWFEFQEHYFLLTMHARHYETALEILDSVLEQERYGKIPEPRNEKWRIFEAYLRYLVEQGLLRESRELYDKEFNLLKFLNDVPIHSMDKRGVNVPILIVHLLFLIERNDFDEVIKRADGLRKYAQRYLRLKGQPIRANIMLRMIATTANADFDYVTVKSRTGKYTKLLLESRDNMDIGNMEILPYEFVWERVLYALKKYRP